MARRCLLVLAAVPALLAHAWAEEAKNPSLAMEVEDYLAEAPAPAPGDTTMKAEWKTGKGLVFGTADGSFTMHVGGRIFWDNVWISSDDFASAQTQDASYFRAVRLEVDGTMFTNAFYKVQVDFAGGDVVLKDVYLGLRKLGAVGTFTAGHFREPLSLDELTSNRFILFMERSAAGVAFAPSRNNGLMVNNNFLTDGLLGVWLGIFKQTNDQGTAVDDGGYAFTMRVAAFFLHDEDRNRVLHFGFGYSLRNAVDNTLQFQARPDIGTGARFVDTGTFTSNEENLFNFELAFMIRTVHVQAEFFLVDCSGAGGPEATFTGWYVEIGWFVVGGEEVYSTEKKVFERPKLDRTLHAGGKGLGAWQVAFRYDTIDLTDGGIAGGVQDCFTIGANWWWNPHMRVMFNMIFADIRNGGPFGEGDLTIFGMRFQVDF
ncbi:MAG: OprO/OprP family phosphate-selective porin [Planctomycetota bacterium]